MTAPSPNSWDEDALADDAEGCASPEIADTGGALIGLFGWAALVFAVGVLWLVIECVRG